MSVHQKGKRKAEVHPFFAKGPSKKPRNTTDEVSPVEVLNLQELLDFTGLETRDDIVSRFDAISKALLHDYLLVVTSADGAVTRLQILEHEFYLQKGECHEDPFAHGSEEQKVMGRWYFHRAPRPSADSNRSSTSPTEYRSGSRKGMDLTIGRAALSPDSPDASKLLRGGILLRSIRVLGSNPRVVSGPSLLVDQVLSLSGASDIPDLVQTKWNGNISAFPSADGSSTQSTASLRIVSKTSFGIPSVANPPTIYNSPRIGLELSHPGTTSPKIKPLHSRIVFLPRKYRYFISPNELVANGRAQTFVGMALHFSSSYPDLDAALSNMKLTGDICRTMGLKDNTAKKYLVDYRAGRNGGADLLEEYIGSKGKGTASSPATYLKMMGAISSLT